MQCQLEPKWDYVFLLKFGFFCAPPIKVHPFYCQNFTAENVFCAEKKYRCSSSATTYYWPPHPLKMDEKWALLSSPVPSSSFLAIPSLTLFWKYQKVSFLKAQNQWDFFHVIFNFYFWKANVWERIMQWFCSHSYSKLSRQFCIDH